MWIVELSFAPTSQRLAARPAHRVHLTALHSQGVVRMAGPFADDAGALIIVDVPDRETVDSILAADPYFTTDGVAVVRIREWNTFLE